MLTYEMTIFNLNGSVSHFNFVATSHDTANEIATEIADKIARRDAAPDGWTLKWLGIYTV